MIRSTLAVLMVAALTGCTASLEPMGRNDQSTSREAQLAAYAAAEQNLYPSDVEADSDLQAAAIVNQKNNTVRIYNFTNAPIRGAKLWVNGGYVREVDNIPANSSRTVSFNELYNSSAQTFTSSRAPINRLQLQVGDELHNLQGPAYE